MKPERREFVTFYSPGTFTSETTTQPIDGRDTKVAVTMADSIREHHGARPYGFRFETRIVAESVPDGEGGELAVSVKTVDKSGTYFIGGKLETLDEVTARSDPKENILRSNMQASDMCIVCVTTNGYRSTMPFSDKDFVVDATGTVTEHGDDPRHVAYRQLVKDRIVAEDTHAE